MAEPEKVKKPEKIHHPPHYEGDTPYETIKVLEAWLSSEQFIGFLLGNVLKYLSRAGKKDSMFLDVQKASWYANYLYEYMKRRPG